MKKLFFTVLLLLFFCCGAFFGFIFGENFRGNNSDDKCITECIGNNSNTTHISNCVISAAENKNEEIKEYLNNLKTVMTEEEYKIIQNNQNDWEKYSKSQNEVIYEFIFNKQGTMFPNITDIMNYNIVKQRAEFLSSVYYFYYLYDRNE